MSFQEASYDLWRSQFDGMSVSDAKRRKELEIENGRLKRLLAESLLDNEVTREVPVKQRPKFFLGRSGKSDLR